jgi:hypothetical protein
MSGLALGLFKLLERHVRSTVALGEPLAAALYLLVVLSCSEQS